jgi:pimeloyl-ACP methyl ester carboxylesterase
MSQNAHAFILLGGFWGPDGWATSVGMLGLREMLKTIVPVSVYTWNQYEKAAQEVLGLQDKSKIILLGYSGGGSRATWLANLPTHPRIDLMVLYDPSPSWQMEPISENVKKAISYHNTAPFFFGLGGGVLIGRQVETVNIAENHMLVQSDVSLHQRTVAEVRKILV